MQEISKRQKKFNESHSHITDSPYELETLYAQNLMIDKLEKIRSNTSTIVWIIVIGIVLSIITASFL